MSAGSQIQMAPQSTINTTHQPVHSQDSNMSTGSSHSDKEVDPNTPEKVPRTPSERKRKRKADDSSGAPGKGVRNATSDKKINDYFKHSGNSPIRHGGAKSPSPQQPYPMFPPSPQQVGLPSPQVNTVPYEFYKQPPRLPPPAMVNKQVQTELTCHRIQEFETQASSDLEVRNNKIEELNRQNEEYRHQISTQQKTTDQHKQQINKCIEVVKKLLKEKSSIEKKEARQKCMQNRLRLGQFVTQRVGATFQENWTDGHAFQELAR
jgi:tousled-like kinase